MIQESILSEVPDRNLSSTETDRRVVALLGQPDAPTDALKDYCFWLGRGLAKSGWMLECERFPWPQGWFAALRWLWRKSPEWRGRWVLVQYTVFAWSRRGFPLGLLPVLWILRRRGVRSAVVFHDPVPCSGHRSIDRLRRSVQLRVLRRAYSWSDRSIFTIPVDKTSWLRGFADKTVFVPVGANFAGTCDASRNDQPAGLQMKTVAVFGVTGGARTQNEINTIAYAIRSAVASKVPLRLLVLGRHADDAAESLRAALTGTGVELEIYGVLPAETVERKLSGADVLLFVRGGISSRRGSGIAGIVCGLPVVAYSCQETAAPVTDAGVVLVPEGDREALAEALTRVLVDDGLRADLCRHSVQAREQHFSWDAIASKYVEVLSSS